MSISPEDRRRIYEEERARIEAERHGGTETMTLTGLTRNTAALLCYLGGWITGIIFLVLEQKNQFIRFHAAQSIVVFGFLGIVSALLHPIPLLGPFFSVIAGVTACVLWIVLMVKAGQGELFMVPGAGELAQKLLGRVPEAAGDRAAAAQVAPAPVALASSTREAKPATNRHPGSARAGRIVGSAFAIAWSVAMLIFLNFFNDYIAYYHLEQAAGHAIWFREPLLTAAFTTWLPVANAVLAFTIAGHTVLLAIDKYIVREPVLLVLDLFSIASVIALLMIFPFDFTALGSILAGPFDFGAHLTLVLVAMGIAIGALVRFIKIMVNLIRGTASY
jgi:uncharacterized membrane protein